MQHMRGGKWGAWMPEGTQGGKGAGGGTDLMSRVAKLEAGLTSLSEDQHAMRGAFDAFASEMRGSLSSLSAELSSGKQTPWGVLASWAAVILAICGAVGTVMQGSIERNQGRLDGVYAELAERGQWMGRDGQRLDNVEQAQRSRASVLGRVPVLEQRIDQLEEARSLSLAPLHQAVLRLEGALGTLEARMEATDRSRFTHDDWHREKALLESRLRAVEKPRGTE